MKAFKKCYSFYNLEMKTHHKKLICDDKNLKGVVEKDWICTGNKVHSDEKAVMYA